jgi:hypothetical protein
MSTWSDVITDALKLVGVYQQGETLSSEDAAAALRDAGLLLETWDNENLSIYTHREISHALTSGTQTYYIGRGGDIKETSGTAQSGTSNTITLASGEITDDDEYNDFVIVLDGGTGSGQYRSIIDSVASTDAVTVNSDWATTPDNTTTYYIEARRPVKIASAYTRDTEGSDYPIDPGMTNSEWAALSDKDQTGSYPDYLYYRPSFPRGQINLYPSPGSGLTLYLQVREQLTRPGLINSTVSFPPGYERAFVYNLALDIAPRYGMEMSSIVYQTAIDAKAALKMTNQCYPTMQLDTPGRRVSLRRWFYSGD